ncbi:disulfide bond formation protein B [Candidatus Uhrbacteria bacterium]|nr:disulfide bond formation protein B [Candidatus Uhrbacteria bacterium]
MDPIIRLLKTPQTYLYAAFAVALVATVGSLYFSDVMRFPPCVLCWYQRIAMYPLVFIVAVGVLLDDTRVWIYGLPTVVVGFLVAAYHNLLYYGFIPQKLQPCTIEASCSERYFELFGFVSIPMMSLLGFVAVGTCLLIYRRLVANKA